MWSHKHLEWLIIKSLICKFFCELKLMYKWYFMHTCVPKFTQWLANPPSSQIWESGGYIPLHQTTFLVISIQRASYIREWHAYVEVRHAVSLCYKISWSWVNIQREDITIIKVNIVSFMRAFYPLKSPSSGYLSCFG